MNAKTSPSTRYRAGTNWLPGTDLPNFTFTDEQRAEINSALPEGAQRKDVVLRELERLGQSYLGNFGYPPNAKEHAKRWRAAHDSLLEAKQAICRARRDENYLQGLVLMLADAAADALFTSDQCEIVAMGERGGVRLQMDWDNLRFVGSEARLVWVGV